MRSVGGRASEREAWRVCKSIIDQGEASTSQLWSQWATVFMDYKSNGTGDHVGEDFLGQIFHINER